jgi:hypothetical protein
MTTIRPEVTGRVPLAVTFDAASQITGLGLTSLWKAAKDGRLRLIRPPGIRRTLIDYSSLTTLLLPDQTDPQSDAPASRPHSRSRKVKARKGTT